MDDYVSWFLNYFHVSNYFFHINFYSCPFSQSRIAFYKSYNFAHNYFLPYNEGPLSQFWIFLSQTFQTFVEPILWDKSWSLMNKFHL